AITGGRDLAHGRRTDYQSGSILYDGAGNVYQVGTNSYGYDAANRLISGSTWVDTTQYTESFAYDGYGNMTVHDLNTGNWFRELDTFAVESATATNTNRILTRTSETNSNNTTLQNPGPM